MTGGAWIGQEALARLMPMHLLLDRDGVILSCGPTLRRLLAGGADAGEEPAGRVFSDLFEMRHGPAAAGVADLLAGQGRLHVERRGRGDLFFRGLAVPAGEGALINLSFGIGVVEAVQRHALTEADFAPTDLTVELLYLYEAKTAVLEELRALNDRLQGDKVVAEEQALTDPLTGLRNRRALDLALERGARGMAVVHLDLDRFKQVNDALGHPAGDHVLAEVGRRLQAASRRDDLVARIGGDEFVVLMPGMDRAEVATPRVEAILAAVTEPLEWQGIGLSVGASAGMMLASMAPGLSGAELLARADVALYAAKRAGRGQVRLWASEMLVPEVPESASPSPVGTLPDATAADPATSDLAGSDPSAPDPAAADPTDTDRRMDDGQG